MTRRFARLALVASTCIALAGFAPLHAAAATLTPPPPPGATCETSPERTVCFWLDTAFHTPGPVPYGVSCAGFSVKVQLAGERRFRFVYDADGVLVERDRHISYSGSLSNSVTGAWVAHEGAFAVVDDFVAGTSTISGMLSRTVVPGDGLIWRNIGRVVISLASGAVLFEAGEHGTYDVGGDPSVAAALCSALS
jgi:hypothetical protein